MLKNKISKEDFFKYMELLRRNRDYIDSVYNCTNRQLDLINLNDSMCEPYQIIVKAFFTPEELDIIGWYMWEYNEGHMKIYDNDEIIADLKTDEDLWEYLNRD